MRDIKESDWKVLRKLRPVALDRFCLHVLEDLGRLATGTSETPHQRYLNAYELMRERDVELSRIFDNLSRSRAFQCIAQLKSRGLISADEYASFSKELRDGIDALLG